MNRTQKLEALLIAIVEHFEYEPVMDAYTVETISGFTPIEEGLAELIDRANDLLFEDCEEPEYEGCGFLTEEGE